MPDWTSSMQQSFEYYVVDPGTWKDKKRINNVKSCSIQRDLETDTLGSATIDIVESVGECYVRVYLVTIQNGLTERHPLGTYLVQTPSSSFDGKIRSVTMDAYTPLIELKENQPPLGYFIPETSNIMSTAYDLVRDNVRAPVVHATRDDVMYYDFVADPNDNWLVYVRDLISNAKHQFDLDEMGRILFSPKQDTASLQPVWTYNNDNSSILYPEFTLNHDLFDVPNVVEVVHSRGSRQYYAKVVNDDPNSPTSVQRRGRVITRRITDPNLGGDNPTESQINEYAERTLRELSTVEYSVSYKHAYCAVRCGDCVRLDWPEAGLNNIKAKVISQSITCEPGCPVQERAVFTTELWR